jgi:NDP-sugar pyrophosphorylase family protein
MRAIILAGGKGTRLAPLTEVIPKSLVPVGGMPILEMVIRHLQQEGFKRVTLAVGYMADLIKAYFQDGSKWGVKINYSYEETPLGTAGPLALVDDLDDTFLVMNADVLTSLNYAEFIRFHHEQGGVATIGSFQKQVKIDLGVIVAGEDYQIKDYVEKPTISHLVSMGIYLFEPSVLNFLRGKGHLDFPDLVKILLKAKLKVSYYPFTGYWLDIGRHDDYAKATEDFENLKGKIGFPSGKISKSRRTNKDIR